MEINTEKLVERLTSRLDLDRVFMAKFDFLGTTKTHLLLVINPVSGLSLKMLLPIIELCLLDQPSMSFEILPFGEWKNKLSHGSLFYSFISLPQHRLYASDRKSTKDLTLKELLSVVTLSTEVQAKLELEASELLKGSQLFSERENYLKASFMLHQSLSSSIKLLQSFVLAKTNKVPSLENRIRTLSSHFPELRTKFLNNEMVDGDRLKLLDKAYHAVKQNQDLEITESDFEFLRKNWSVLQDQIKKLYTSIRKELESEVAHRQMQQKLQQIQQQLEQQLQQQQDQQATSENSKQATAEQLSNHTVEEDFSQYPWPASYRDDVNTLIDLIQQNHNPEKIILINYRIGEFSGHSLVDCGDAGATAAKMELFLIVIMKRRGPIRYRDITKGNASALVLYFDTEHFKRKLLDNQNTDHLFFVSVLQKGTVVRRKKTFNEQWEMLPMDWARQHWHAKFYFAASYHLLAELDRFMELVNQKDHAINNFLAGQLVEKGVMTFLKITLGYVPKDLTLDKLIDFTVVVDSRIKDFLLPGNEAEEESLRTILDYQRVWRKSIRPEKLMPLAKTPKEFATAWIAFIYPICIQALEYLEEQGR